MRLEGTIKTWNDDRGFGFIQPAQGGPDVFVHVKAFGTRGDRPQAGQRVSFEVEQATDGKKCAVRVRAPGADTKSRALARRGTASYLVIVAFVPFYVVVAAFWRVPGWAAGLYAVSSMVTFIFYWLDKRAAARDAWRVPEQTLLFLGFLCGWPGAIVAQQMLRHKSNKVSFRLRFWLTVILNVAGFVLLAAFGPQLLRR